MSPKHIVRGQNISPELAREAKELRKNLTRAEKQLWDRLRRNQLAGYHFRRQQVIDRFIVDFYCHKAGLVIELDGPIHKRQVEYDQERDARLHALGFTVVRYRNDEVTENIDGLLGDILAVLDELGEDE